MAGWTSQMLQEALIANPDLARRNPGEAVRLVPRFPADYVPSANGQPPIDSKPSGVPDGWLHRLMECPSWNGRRLDPEEELSLWVACELRKLTRSGALRAVWSRMPSEIRRGGKLAAMWQCLGRVLGVVKGAPDLWFLSPNACGCIELKIENAQADMIAGRRRRTYLRSEQKDFREWCVSLGVQYATCRSVPDVTKTLREWGLLA
jgi:hypothetical protein